MTTFVGPAGSACSAAPPAFVIQCDRGAITSLKRREDVFDTDYIAEEHRLGDVTVAYRFADGAWQQIDTSVTEPRSTSQAEAVYATDALEIATGFNASGDAMRWSIRLKNTKKKPVEIGSIALPFSMNQRYVWDGVVTATKRVLRHSFISANGSFLFWQRCNSIGPYLTMTPVDGTALEYFDEFSLPEKKGRVYRVFIHAKAQQDAIKENNGSWRQPLTSIVIEPGASHTFAFDFRWAQDYAAVRDILYQHGLFDVHVVPGMTVPRDQSATIAIRTTRTIANIVPEHPAQTVIEPLGTNGPDTHLYRVSFKKLGENMLTVECADGRKLVLEFFSTEPVEMLIRKRAAFLVERQQHRDTNAWFFGLISEWNMKSQTLLSPEHLDLIKGWREYAVACDDPGLCKPAFLAAKNAEAPVQREITALDEYIEHCVWGGLQRTTNETYPYGIYGIPNWKRNRDSEDPGPKGNLHIWRVYDYPHIALMYFKMYEVATRYPEFKTKLDRLEYLERAYNTALAMFTIPIAIVDVKWSAYATGLYNELEYEALIEALDAEGRKEQAALLRHHWDRKVHTFVLEKPNLFGSEYPYDTTGFESTHAFAVYALRHIGKPGYDYTPEIVARFMEGQMACNIGTRGWLEPAYYLLGSDYRGGGSSYYTLSYMAQMGGWAVQDYALHYSKTPFEHLRLAYASMLSSWALMNTGTRESNYGYWFPGPENDGGAGGGFEPLAYGHTWLEQPHGRGSWYYGCEIDLGFSGALRGAATIVADDPLFGRIAYGGILTETTNGFGVVPRDGVRRRFFARIKGSSIDIVLDRDNFDSKSKIQCRNDGTAIAFKLDSSSAQKHIVKVSLAGLAKGMWFVRFDSALIGKVTVDASGTAEISLPVSSGGAYDVLIGKE